LLAIVVSILIHLVLLFTPMIELAPTEIPLPPLQAKLEEIPKLAPPSAAKKKPAVHKTKPKPQPPAAAPTPEPTPSTEAISEPTPAEHDTAEATPELTPPSVAATDLPPPSAHPLPKHAQLTFSVYKSGTSFAIGEAQHRLDIDAEQHYTIRTRANTTGVVRFLKHFDLTQTSTGLLTPYGLQPNKFSEEKSTSDGTLTNSAEFDWQGKTLYFSSGNSIELPNGSQDIVSFMYQLSQLQWSGNPLSMYISNGKKLEHYLIQPSEEELINTPKGKLRAIPMRKIHGPNEEGLNIWLAVEYRLLPIKISQIERDGSVAGEMLISDIRVGD
jgi:hypothetical protein